MPIMLRGVMLRFLEGQIDGVWRDDPAWVAALEESLEDLLQLDRMSFEDKDHYQNAIMDYGDAARLWGFQLGIQFAMEIGKEII